MALMNAILRKIRSTESFPSGRRSPPPEESAIVLPKRRKRVHVDKFSHVSCKLDARPPVYGPLQRVKQLSQFNRDLQTIITENAQLLTLIHMMQVTGGRVDSHWKKPPHSYAKYYHTKRVDFAKRITVDNIKLYRRITGASAKVATTASLEKSYRASRYHLKMLSQKPPCAEDSDLKCPTHAAFVPHFGVKRPRVHLTLCINDGAIMGDLTVELFTDVCPNTCELFCQLLDGDGVGYGYVGTTFFRKVPGLFWSGGDVICDNGFGCYCQRGRVVPIGAENYHFPHSMPGLLSMRMTCDDEMCGSFNITFKPLPQFDLRNSVFGRVILPSAVFDSMETLGAPLSTRPVVRLAASRRRVCGKTRRGVANTNLPKPLHFKSQ